MLKKILFVLLLSLLSFTTHFGFAALPERQEKEVTISQKIDDMFVPIVEIMANVLFFDPFAAIGIYDQTVYSDGKPVLNKDGSVKKQPIPLVVVWLVCGAIFFTIKMRFINFRAFWYAINLVRGKYDKGEHSGEVSHFQALATALSGTVGLGNIAGVAVAISLGGPGATFWMIIAGLLGMTSKFVECTLGVKYRRINLSGVVFGGPMYYLSTGLNNIGLGGLGRGLAICFAILCVGGSFGGGNMFQVNQAFGQLSGQFPALADYGFWVGLVFAALVGMVIIGGIKTIAKVTDKIVPFMCLLYLAASLVIIMTNIDLLDDAVMLIFKGAFGNDAMYGGFIGVLVLGFRRAVFSNEAGVGSASIAHAAVKTDEPITEGFVSLLEPFIDTVVICTITALVLIVTGVYQNDSGLTGSQLTSIAFASQISWFPHLLTITIVLFAFSTMIAWSYYGTNAWVYIFGGSKQSIVIYKIVYLSFVVVGASSQLSAVIDFSDMMILGMAFPNILGLVLLAPEVYEDLQAYIKKHKL
jgi:AGCS family alanine or glycine:cation symporter